MEYSNIIFLRHADTQKDPEKHPTQWGLSELGIQQAEEVSKLEIMKEVTRIYVSEEIKTSLTVAPIATLLHITPEAMPDFNEVARGEKFLSKEEFEAEKVKQLEDLGYAAFNGETGTEALKRFIDGVEKVATRNPQSTVLIVTHGTILNIYFAHLLDKNGELPHRWSETGFCAYGIVQNGKVVKDII